jgi:hypothetical protein
VTVFKDFQSLQKECVILKENLYNFSIAGNNNIKLEIYNPYPYNIEFRHKELPVVFQLAFIKNGYREVKKNLELPADISELKPGDRINVECSFYIRELPAGDYKIAVCSETGILYDTYNSNFSRARVTE